MAESTRIDGWKAIGAYFGRDRTTVMRWARERNLPVRRLPGGKTGTVFALKEDLDHWSAGQTDLQSEAAIEPPSRGGLLQHRWKLAGLGAGALALAGGGVWMALPSGSKSPGLPSDPAVSALYLQARDDWAARTPASLQRAITGLEATTRREPGFAPAWASLADAYLLSREFDAVPDARAFGLARKAADRALSLDGRLPDGHRARGFILYWCDNRPRESGKAFRRAIALAPQSAQSHFWYGNVLSDNGQHAAALRELNEARLLDPGSVAIQTDLAWALWSAGNDAKARQSLNDLASAHPDFAVVHDCLSMISLADGDYVGYVQGLSDYARLRQHQGLLNYASDLRAALEVGATKVQQLLLDHALADIAAGTSTTYRVPVFLSSIAGDRKQTVRFLNAADRRHEAWGEAGVVARIARLWADDAEIIALLRRRRPEPVE